MQRYRKKPVELEAVRFTGGNASEILTWAYGSDAAPASFEPQTDRMWIKQKVFPEGTDCLRFLVIPTLEVDMEAAPGDWVIKGVKGEFYPCKPDIFNELYEAV